MSDAPNDRPLVMQRSSNIDKFKKSYVTRAICELKFPTMLELGGSFPPASFAKALRRSYPTLEAGQEVKVNLGDRTSDISNAHIFKAVKKKWAVTLKHSSVGLDGGDYAGYQDFRRRVEQLVEAALPIADTDIWTRVGLRYINTVHCHGDPVQGWINPQLVGPLVGDAVRSVMNYGGYLQLGGDEKGLVLRHQLKLGELDEDGNISSVKYDLDIDAFSTGVEIDKTLAVLDDLHAESFDLFDWSLGEPARAYLRGEGE